MKTAILIFISSITWLEATAQSGSDGILGYWTNPDQSQILEFVQNGDTYEAIIRQSEKPEAIGKTPITGLEYRGNSRYRDGQIYVPQRDMKADCSIKLFSKDEFRLTVKVGMMSRKVDWTRVDFENPSEG
ncbi:MAG: DUF2147 domain-containing protein [Bacteroidota bacterium]